MPIKNLKNTNTPNNPDSFEMPMDTIDISSFAQTKKFGGNYSRKASLSADAFTLELKCDEKDGAVESGFLYIGSECHKRLFEPTSIQIAVGDTVMLLGENLPVNAPKFDLKKRGNHKQIQKRDFIQDIFEFYDFEVKSTRITLGDIQYKMYEEGVVAVVKVPTQEESSNAFLQSSSFDEADSSNNESNEG